MDVLCNHGKLLADHILRKPIHVSYLNGVVFCSNGDHLSIKQDYER